ncbi:MAG: ComEC/Rec2 family competence protein [Clostridium sp.]
MNRDTYGFPMIYYAIATFIGSVYAMVYRDSIFIANLLFILMVIIFFLTVNYREVIIIICFFTLGIISNFLYFNFDYKYNAIEYSEVRIVKKTKYSHTAILRNRLVQLDDIYDDKVKEGSKILIKGTYINKPVYNKGIAALCKVKELKYTEDDFTSKIYTFKQGFYESLKNQMGEDKAAIVMALCLGDEVYISDEKKEELKLLGIVHAISVSGLHMAIVYKVLQSICGKNLGILGAFIFLIITGSKASTVRAFIMIVMADLALRTKQEYNKYTALSLAAIILIIQKPFNVSSPGFMLSFLAVIGIFMFNKKIDKFLYKVPEKIRTTVSLSLSAQIFTFPYMAIVFGEGNIGFILGNLILLPLLTMVIVLGIICLVVSPIHIMFFITCKITSFILSCYEGYRDALLKITPNILPLDYLDGVLFLVIITVFILMLNGNKRIKYIPIAFIVAVFISNYKFNLNISYFKIGWGDGILIEHRGNSTLICENPEEVKTIEGVKKIKKFIDIDNMKSTPIELGDGYKIGFLSRDYLKNINDKIVVISCDHNVNNIFLKEKNSLKDFVKLGRYNIELLPKGERKFYKNTIEGKYILINHKIFRVK